jgi:hypothetical protein
LVDQPWWLSRVLEEVEAVVLICQVVACLSVFLVFLVCLGMLRALSGPWRIEMLKPASQRLSLYSSGFSIVLGGEGIVAEVVQLLLL